MNINVRVEYSCNIYLIEAIRNIQTVNYDNNIVA